MKICIAMHTVFIIVITRHMSDICHITRRKTYVSRARLILSVDSALLL